MITFCLDTDDSLHACLAWYYLTKIGRFVFPVENAESDFLVSSTLCVRQDQNHCWVHCIAL